MRDSGTDDEGPRGSGYRPSGTFHDDDGNATVTFADGESGDVNIREEDDED